MAVGTNCNWCFWFCFVFCFCFVLFCFVLFCFVLFCFVLFCFVLFCFVLFCFDLFQCWALWEWCPFPCFLIHLGFFPALYFIQHKYLLVPAVMASQHLLCHLYKALLYVHDIELVEPGSGGPCLDVFFPPYQT